MNDEKNRTTASHHERRPEREDEVLASEYEPPAGYKVQWRTWAAIFALAMGNVCAAMSNTVSFFAFNVFKWVDTYLGYL